MKLSENKMRKGLVRFAFLILMPAICQSQTIKELKDIDRFIDTTMMRWGVPGLAIAIVKDGKVIYKKGYGYKNLRTMEKVTPQTLFSIASSSKAFTATLAAMVVDEKKIEFDVPLRNYFPEFQMYDKNATEKVTLRDLLTHRSGIPRQKFFSINTPATRREVRDCFRYFEPLVDLRSRFQYCNETYSVAGDMIAERVGTTWEDLIRRRILEPLGMINTKLSAKEVIKTSDYASPYIDWEEGKPEEMEYHDADILGPAGCIISNVDDLSKWIIFNLNKGKVDNKQLVSPALLTQTQSPQMVIQRPMAYKELFFSSYGMGWFVNNYRGYLQINHGGILYGFSSMVSFLPYENMGVVVLANLNGTPLTDIIERYVYDCLLNLEHVDWNNRFLTEAAQANIRIKATEKQKDPGFLPDTKPSHPIDNYCGTYESKGYGKIIIVNEADSLSTTLLNIKCPLRHYNYDVFDLYHPVEHQGWKVSFISDITGTINSFSLNLGSGLKDIVFKRINE